MTGTKISTVARDGVRLRFIRLALACWMLAQGVDRRGMWDLCGGIADVVCPVTVDSTTRAHRDGNINGRARWIGVSLRIIRLKPFACLMLFRGVDSRGKSDRCGWMMIANVVSLVIVDRVTRGHRGGNSNGHVRQCPSAHCHHRTACVPDVIPGR